QENSEFRAVANRSLEEAAGARGQVQLILDQIQRAGNTVDPSAQPAGETVPERFDDDPVAAMNELVAMRVGPIVQEYFGRTADTEREAAREEQGQEVQKYGGESGEVLQ